MEIPQELLITVYNDPIHAIVHSTFPNIYQQHNNVEFLQSRAILASTNETIEQVNNYILSLIPGNNNLQPIIHSCLVNAFILLLLTNAYFLFKYLMN